VASGWYPPGRRDAEGRLRHYATRFPVVEVDATYYALPSLRNSLLWAERTPEGFRFNVKAFSLLTGHPVRPGSLPAELRPAAGGGSGRDPAEAELLQEVWRRFSEALQPLRATGRSGAVLFQFPPWFAPQAKERRLLERWAERTASWPVAVEFRHPGWWRDDERAATSDLLAKLGFAAVAVDMVQTLDSSIPPRSSVTSPRLAMVRFHGRNRAWGSGSKEERFRHSYSREELTEWLPRLHDMAARSDELHVMFNNCCADAAARAAESMRELLDLPAGVRLPPGA